MLKQLKQMNAELTQMKAKHLEMSKAMFHEVAAKLFEKHPLLNSFGWTQYTPYFNDGDECTFSAHTDSPTINGYSEYNDGGSGIDLIKDSEEFTTELMRTEEHVAENLQYCDQAGYSWTKNRKIGDYGVRKNPNYNPEHKQVIDDVQAFLNELDDSVLRDMFGDHVKVTVTREGVDVSDYDHD